MTRRVRPGFAVGCVAALLAALCCSCASSQIKQVMPRFSTRNASYMGLWIGKPAIFYSLYSLLPGQEAPFSCDQHTDHAEPRSRIRIEDCGIALRPQAAIHLAGRLQRMLFAVERRFRSRIHVAVFSIRLIPARKTYILRKSMVLRPRALKVVAASRFDVTAIDQSERILLRSMAHEIFHMGKHALHRWRVDGDEERDAAIFESCIERDVDGSVAPKSFQVEHQPNPQVVAGIVDPFRSLQGKLEATRLLSQIAGPDDRISSEFESDRFEALCQSIMQ